MLGATRTGALVHPVSVPPQDGELSETGKRDWNTGMKLVKTCVDTHDTATYVHALPISCPPGSNRRFKGVIT
jgi:hypothetical protein